MDRGVRCTGRCCRKDSLRSCVNQNGRNPCEPSFIFSIHLVYCNSKLFVNHIVMLFRVHAYPQEILEKFEFFPIKCRIQRASELYKKGLEINEQLKVKRTFKTKVAHSASLLPHIYS
jgi:hypothetical protein